MSLTTRPKAALRVAITVVVAIGAGALFATSAGAASNGTAGKPPRKPPPVKSVEIGVFGDVLTTKGNRALYYWTPEKEQRQTILCTGGCATAWPPLFVKKWAKIRTRIEGVPGKFGTILRPDGRRQLTHRGLPLYTYAHEDPNEVLCDDVDGWFVIRIAQA